MPVCGSIIHQRSANGNHFEEVGEVLFKDAGLSGIVIFNLSHLLFSVFIDPLRDEAKKYFLRLMSLPIRGLKLNISKTSCVSHKRRRIICGSSPFFSRLSTVPG